MFAACLPFLAGLATPRSTGGGLKAKGTSTPRLRPLSASDIKFEPRQLRDVFWGHDLEFRERLLNFLATDPVFQFKYDMTLDEHRELLLARLKRLAECGFWDGYLTKAGDEKAALRGQAMLECLACHELQTQIKTAVHLGLFGVAVWKFGTEKHHKLLPEIESLRLPGSYCLTELGHGTNVKGLETEARYDADTGEFVMRTPKETAQKYWIGNVAKHGRIGCVWAQLYTPDVEARRQGRTVWIHRGVHPFLVPLRDESGKNLPGVRTADVGHKVGMNGIDNGRLWLDGVRIPRDSHLDHLAQVHEDGSYTSSIPDPDRLFAAYMAPLTRGRVIISITSVRASQLALATAVRYSCTRRVFGPKAQPGEQAPPPEVPIMDYQSHQLRLLPLLASTVAFNFAALDLKRRFAREDPAEARELHFISSGLKALSTYHVVRTLVECREACGAQGFKSDSRLGTLLSDHCVSTTYEGDNKVMLQGVGRTLLSGLAKSGATGLLSLTVQAREAGDAGYETHSECDVGGIEYQRRVFALRAADALHRLASSYRDAKERLPEFEAWNSVQDGAMEAAAAHMELHVLDAFTAGIKAAPEELRPVLSALRTLHALSRIDQEAGFLRGRYAGDRATQERVHRLVVRLAAELRPAALDLVDAFGLPAGLLGRCAFDWVDYNASANIPAQLV
eukprot:tig00020927_g15991.t1